MLPLLLLRLLDWFSGRLRLRADCGESEARVDAGFGDLVLAICAFGGGPGGGGGKYGTSSVT